MYAIRSYYEARRVDESQCGQAALERFGVRGRDLAGAQRLEDQGLIGQLLLFMSADDQTQVLAHYTLIDATSPDYTRYVKDYPALADRNNFV